MKVCLSQEAKSDLFTHPAGCIGATKILHRGGKYGDSDWLANFFSTTTNCDEFCSTSQTVDDLDSFSGIQTVYYAKCYNAFGIIPPNKVRFSFVSQIGTLDVDPLLPNSNNKSKCLRMFSMFILCREEGKH